MKFLLSILFFSVIFSNEIENIQKHKIGIFQPFIYNKTPEIEIRTYPLYNFIIPNLEYRKKYSNWVFSLKEELPDDEYWKVAEFVIGHSFFIPTPLLNIVKKEGMGGFVSPEFENFPFMISIKNELEIIFSNQNIKNKDFISTNIGFTFGLSASKIDARTTIDLPLIYPRLLCFYNKGIFNLGLRSNKKLFNNFYLFSDINFLSTPPFTAQLTKFIEHKSLLIWEKSEKIQIQVGYKLVYGEYPFGDMLHLLPFSIIPVPLIDIVWSW